MSAQTNLSFKDGEFTFKGEQLRLFSGAIHYFRVVPEYWEDRLTKAKACGLNTVETYVPWNLHEPRPGHYNNGGILDLRRFVKTAGDLGLYVIFRPGPYICSEWDFGGLPSWLLADPEMKVRTNYKGYQNAVERYFSWLLPQITDLQSSRGGPIIAVQVENEYGSFSFDTAHLLWLRDLLLRSGVTELLVTSDNETCAKGIRELVETSEGVSSESSEKEIVDLFNLPGVLPTANGMSVFEVSSVFAEIHRERSSGTSKNDQLNTVKPNNASRPLMVMELWSGWFDYWGAPIHETTTAKALETTVRYAFSRGSSINLYMFHGGTNFGFLNGALQLPPDNTEKDNEDEVSNPNSNADPDSYPFRPDVTSYDYDAPVSEDGCLTGKYWALRKVILEEREKLGTKDAVPPVPSFNNRAQCPIVVGSWDGASGGEEMLRLGWEDLLAIVTKRVEEKGDPNWMEMYEYHGGRLQSYGYTVYRRSVGPAALESGSRNNEHVINFSGRVRDAGTVLVNGVSCGKTDWSEKDAKVKLDLNSVATTGPGILDIVVENQGRVNYTTSDYQDRFNTQRRGLHGPVSLDGKPLKGWNIIALDFEDDFIENALKSSNWCKREEKSSEGCADTGVSPKDAVTTCRGPALYRGTVKLDGKPADYFLRLEGWQKGVVFVNGFNLGRYSARGPTRSLYVPGPVLRRGENQVVVFEELQAGGQVVLGIEPRLG